MLSKYQSIQTYVLLETLGGDGIEGLSTSNVQSGDYAREELRAMESTKSALVTRARMIWLVTRGCVPFALGPCLLPLLQPLTNFDKLHI